MPTLTRALARTAASTSSTTLYTVPSGTVTVVTDIVVANTSASSGTFTISLNGVVFANTVTVGGNDSTIIQVKQPLAATQTITGLASATSINFHIGGVEIS